MTAAITVADAIADPSLFGPWFRDRDTWRAWMAFLAALFGLPMTADQMGIFTECTGRARAPSAPSREAWLACGRRAGKSFILALTAVFLACFRDYLPFLSPGERATIRLMASDRDQSRVIFRYISALLTDIPMLAALVERTTADSIDLTNRVTIECGTASFRATRGYSYAAVLCDEIAFFRSDDSANPDQEILRAIRPGMLTIPGAMLLCASSPYSRKGALWDAFTRWYGDDDAPALVWKAPTRTMNPTVPQADIDAALERDPAGAAAEYLAEFRTDVEDFLSIEAVRACIRPGERERMPDRSIKYVGFVDPSGGSADAMTLAIAHKKGDTAVLDLVREVKPPFSPEAVCVEFAEDLKRFRIASVEGDRYAGEWPREQLRKNGIAYKVAEQTRSEMYLDLLPLINSQAVDLLDNDRLVTQLVALERRTSRGGRDSIDHGPGGHDDVANAVAGVLVRAIKLLGTGADFRPRLGNLPPRANVGHADIKARARGERVGP
jgi:hypothetical protein